MNGSQGIQPTVELATTNGGNGFAYPYPVYPMMGGFGGNGGFGGFGSDSAIWLIVLLALIWGNNNGNGGFFGGNGGFDNGYAWLSNGQKEIMSNTNNGFDTLHLSNQLESTRDGIASLSNQLCNCCSDINGNISNSAFNAEIAAANRQMANMQQSFNNQLSTLNGFNQISSDLASCCCENRLALANLGSDIAREACADRQAVSEGVRDIIANQTAGIQTILDKICQQEIDALKTQNANLQTQLNLANMQASQTAQTARILSDNAAQTQAIEQYLNPAPIPAYVVQNPNCCGQQNYGCGCGGF